MRQIYFIDFCLRIKKMILTIHNDRVIVWNHLRVNSVTKEFTILLKEKRITRFFKSFLILQHVFMVNLNQKLITYIYFFFLETHNFY